MSNLLSRSKLFLRRNTPTILTCAGGIGVIVTSVMAVKATPKALTLIEAAKDEKGSELTKLETVRVAGPVYIPTIVVGLSTLACIFGANMLNKRQQAALTSAYALLNSSYNEYKHKIDELYGPEANANVRREIAKDKYDECDISSEDDDKELFFDHYSNRYFRSTLAKVRDAEYRINRTMVMRDYAYLNEFYEFLEIEPIESGWETGWSAGACQERYWQTWLDFEHDKVVMDDGLECYIISMRNEPIVGFADYC